MTIGFTDTHTHTLYMDIYRKCNGWSLTLLSMISMKQWGRVTGLTGRYYLIYSNFLIR